MSEPHLEIVKLFPIEADGRLRPSVEVAVILGDPTRSFLADERAIYAGNIEGPITFDRIERRSPPTGNQDQEWRGPRGFAVKSYGDKILKRVRDWTAVELRHARERGALLQLALDVAVTQRDRAQAWANERARHVATLPEEQHKSRYGGLLAAMAAIERETEGPHEQFSRILALNSNISSLGEEFRSHNRGNEHFRAARLMGYAGPARMLVEEVRAIAVDLNVSPADIGTRLENSKDGSVWEWVLTWPADGKPKCEARSTNLQNAAEALSLQIAERRQR